MSFLSPDASFFLSKLKVEAILQGLSQEEYRALYYELHSIPPPHNGQYSMMGLKLWLLTSSERSWRDLAWGCYRSFLNDPLKEARREMLSDEGNFVALCLFQNLSFT